MSKVNETEETVVENVEGEVVETENFSEKAKAGLKKYGKNVVAASLVGVALIGYAIGARKSEDSDDTTYEIEDSSSSDES